MSGMSRTSSLPAIGGVPSCSIEIDRPSCENVIGTPTPMSSSSTDRSGWPWIGTALRNVTLDGGSAQAARPNTAEPMSGGSTMSPATGTCPGSMWNSRQSSRTDTSRPNWRIMSSVSSR